MHCARTHFNVIRLLQNAVASSPEFLQAKDEILKAQPGRLYVMFYFRSQELDSSNGLVVSLRSVWCSTRSSRYLLSCATD